MKKVIVISVLTILVILLTACGASAGSAQPTSASGSSAGNTSVPAASTPASNASTSSPIPANGTPATGLSALQLAAGMLKLTGTSNAVTAQEATQLLPLWQSLQQAESVLPQGTPGAPQPNPTMTALRQQVAAQITAIENAMPPAQIQAITAMNLSGQDIFAAFQQAGITMGGAGRGGFSSSGGTFTPPQGGTPRAVGTPGVFRSGFGQGGGRMGMGGFLPSSVVTGIVQFLQKTAGS